MPDDVPAKLALAERVGLELRRLGLTTHVVHLRRYYATTRAGRTPGDGEWDDAFVVEWARQLRLPPHERDYAVKPRMSSCGCPTPKKYTQSVFPGGSKHACGACREVWLELG
jgi:hypothetical protein